MTMDLLPTLIKENERIQRKWDKEFNRQVVDLVRKAIHRGLVQVHYIEKMRLEDYDVNDTQITAAKIPTKVIEIRYDKYRKDAYQHVREQAERAVLMTMPPPKLHRLP